MTLLERYLKGESAEVYHELYELGEDALHPNNFIQSDLVLKETFKRVRFNLGIIYEELKNINYHFVSTVEHDWQKPILPPNSNVDLLLTALKSKIKNAGYIPLSLEYFYRFVGSCNFCWDWQSIPEIPWEGADPIDIPPITTVIADLVYDDYDRDEILLTGDYLQKDNVSGSCYNIQLTKFPSLDSLLLHENWDINFIEYLRITFENCGFAMADQCKNESLYLFCSKVRPKLSKI